MACHNTGKNTFDDPYIVYRGDISTLPLDVQQLFIETQKIYLHCMLFLTAVW